MRDERVPWKQPADDVLGGRDITRGQALLLQQRARQGNVPEGSRRQRAPRAGILEGSVAPAEAAQGKARRLIEGRTHTNNPETSCLRFHPSCSPTSTG